MFIELESGLIINTNFIESFNDTKLYFNNNDNEEFIITINDYDKLVLALLPKERTVKNHEPKAEALELFEKLHALTGGKGKPIFSINREKKLNEFLTKHRMNKEQLIKAATNIGKDEWLQGKNPNNKRYGDIDYLFSRGKDGTLRATRWAEDQQEKQKRMF